jgi:uncharacterized phosphosugar-binding protein
MQIIREYLTTIQDLIQKIIQENEEALKKGSQILADTISQDKLIHVFGTGGHSVMGAEEIFYRAGGLVPVNAILDDGLLLANGAIRSTLIERTPGYAKTILDYYDLIMGDTLIIVNAYGVNSVTIDTALECKRRGITSIAITSVELQRNLPLNHPSRHPSKYNLCDLADIVIDTKVPMGDAVISIPGVSQKVGACSTFANAIALNSLILLTIEELIRRGIKPPIWQSANSPGGDEHNIEFIKKYKHRIKKL